MPGAAKPPSRKSLVLEFLRLHQPPEITREVLAALRCYVRERLPDSALSDRYLLDLAEQSGVPVSRDLGGLPLDLVNLLHFHDLAAAEASLRDLHREYSRGDLSRGENCRRAVLRLRRRLESLLLRPALTPEKRAEKEEILSWVRVWLETPDLFPTWLDLRTRRLSTEPRA